MVKRLLVSKVGEVSVALKELIVEPLHKGKKVLWLISGGSSLPIAVDTMRLINIDTDLLHNLAITLIDDKYMPGGELASNGAQFISLGFEPRVASYREILCDEDMAQTTELFEVYITEKMAWADVSIGQFGLGEGYHTGGILPGSVAAQEKTSLTCGYEQYGVGRITVTPALIVRLDIAFVNSMGEAKRPLVRHFLESKADVVTEPTQALKLAKQTYLYSDVLPRTS